MEWSRAIAEALMGGLLLRIGEFPMNQGDGILNSLGQLQKLGGEFSLYRWGPAQMGLAIRRAFEIAAGTKRS